MIATFEVHAAVLYLVACLVCGVVYALASDSAGGGHG